MAKNPPAFAGDTGDGGSGSSLGQEDLLEEEMATHSTILAWRSPWTEEPGGLQSMELKRVRHRLSHFHFHDTGIQFSVLSFPIIFNHFYPVE